MEFRESCAVAQVAEFAALCQGRKLARDRAFMTVECQDCEEGSPTLGEHAGDLRLSYMGDGMVGIEFSPAKQASTVDAKLTPLEWALLEKNMGQGEVGREALVNWALETTVEGLK